MYVAKQSVSRVFFFNDTATTEIYTLSLHDALPIWTGSARRRRAPVRVWKGTSFRTKRPSAVEEPHRIAAPRVRSAGRSEEHTSELQSRQYLVCRLLLEKKKKNNNSLTLTRMSTA